MKKSIHSLTLVAALSLTAAPALNAEPMGTNPHPQIQQTSMLRVVQYTVRAYFGL